MKLIYSKIIVAALVIISVSSCSKYLDVNSDPNRVTDDNITPELLLTGAEVSVGNRSVGIGFLQNWVGYVAPNGDFAPDLTQQTYNITYNFGTVTWQNYDATLFYLYKAKYYAQLNNNPLIASAAMILSAKLFQEKVDMFGDMPYTQTFNILQNPTPKYDKATDIYTALQKSLDSAITNLATATATAAFTKADVVNKGDLKKWIHLANTIKLRICIRQSEVSGYDPSAEIAKIVANGGCLQAGETISVNPGYVNDVNKQSPFYAAFGYDPTGVKATTSTNANEYIINILAESEDNRLSRFFAPVSGSFVGNVYGQTQSDLNPGNSTSYFGPGIIGSATQNQWILTSFQSLFLQAEAAARGWNIGSDAQTLLNKAVTESFNWLGADTTGLAAYLKSNASLASTSTAMAKAKLITYQKYIANTCIDPLESWSDIRRLNMLADMAYISMNPNRVGPGTLPVRLFYAQSELSSNQANVPTGVTQFSPKIFWQP